MEIKIGDKVRLKSYLKERIYVVEQVFCQDIRVNDALICIAGDIRIVNENDTKDVLTLHKTQVEII